MRQEIADKAAHALGCAMRAVGLGARAYGKWTLHDRLGYADDVVIYCRSDGQGWQPGCDDIHRQLEHFNELIPCTYVLLKQGRRVIEFSAMYRWEIWFGCLETYTSKTAEQLAALRESRERNRKEREEANIRAEFPLYAEQLIALRNQ